MITYPIFSIVNFVSHVDVALMGDGRGVCRVLVGRLEGKRPPGRPRGRWEDKIKMDH